jgi:hypothetical protein
MALAPAFALQRATTSPPMNPMLSVEDLCEVRPRQLFIQDIHRTLRKNARRERKVLVDETVERNKGGNGRKYREQPIENNSSRDGQQVIFVHLPIHPPENSAPVGPKEEPGRTDARSNGRRGRVTRNKRIFLRRVASRPCRRAAAVSLVHVVVCRPQHCYSRQPG